MTSTECNVWGVPGNASILGCLFCLEACQAGRTSGGAGAGKGGEAGLATENWGGRVILTWESTSKTSAKKLFSISSRTASLGRRGRCARRGAKIGSVPGTPERTRIHRRA